MATDLKHYLDYYKTIQSPGYAVLVTGDWGIGKTYQVKHCMSGTKYLYVSLFGLTSADAIRVAVLSNLAATNAGTKQRSIAKALPALGDVITKLEKFKSLGRLAQGVAESLLAETLRSKYIIVFDDLERSCLPTKDLLGVLNHYIEDLQLRVIIISNERELISNGRQLKSDFSKYKEKIIGHSIELVPQVTEAYDAFVSELEIPQMQTFAVTHREQLLRVFSDSGCSSLRILRHALNDLSRLRTVLTDKHLANPTAIHELVGVFCARDIEIRAENIDERDLRERAENLYAGLFETETDNVEEHKLSRITQSEAKFPLVNFDSDLINVDVLSDMLVKGRFVKKEINESIDASHHFQTPDQLPPWRVLMQLDDLEDATLERAIERMRKQLRDLEVTEIGEIYHVFSLMMMMSENNIVEEKITDYLTIAKSYIDRLVQHKKLVAIDDQTVRVERVNHAYAGYGYHVTHAYAEEFNELQNYVTAANRTVYESQLPAAAEQLLELMANEVDHFLEQICRTNSERRNTFASVPILAHIEPTRFVETWLQCPVANWRTISIALDIRYEDSVRRKIAGEQGILVDEHEWALSVYQILKREAERASKLSAFRLRRSIPTALKVLAGDADVSELRS